ALPFDRTAVAAFRTEADAGLVADAEPRATGKFARWAPWVGLATGAAALAVSAGLVVSAHQLHDSAGTTTDGIQRDGLNRRIAGRESWARATGLGGGALVLGGLGMLWWQGRF